MKNEAELTAKIDQVLSNVFPTFKSVKLSHQKSFSIKFGHHNVVIDNEEPSKYAARAIYDILLKLEDRNCILLELKKEGLKLTEEDIEQGLSYARLIHAMPPITLISNGKDNLLYDTFTKEKIKNATVDLETIQKLIDNSFELATNDLKDAVNLLLNKDPKLFASTINAISESKFERLTGSLEIFSKPIVKEFSIPREVVEQAYKLFLEGQLLVGIIGSAFSGKTNILFQFFERYKNEPNHFILYIDSSDHNYSVFQQLANNFAGAFKSAVDVNKIRDWFITALHSEGALQFYLLIDNFNNDIPYPIKSEVIELIDLFKDTNHGILYTVDELSYKKLAFIEHRQYKTIIGEKSKTIQLNELSDKEYDNANQLLFEKFKTSIENGGQYTPEYREPRAIRHLGHLYDSRSEGENKYTKIIAVPDVNLLRALAQNKIYSKRTHSLYKKIAYCFHNEAKLRSVNPEFNIAASGTGVISLVSFKKYFPEHVDELLKSSLVVLKEIKDDIVTIFPKIPELVAYHSIEIINLATQKFAENKSISKVSKYFISAITPVPFCDVVGAAILLEIGTPKNVDLFSKLVIDLLKTPPRIEKIKAGTKTLMYLEGVGNVQLNFNDDDEESSFVSDFLPFAVLSQLAHFPLKMIGNKKYSEYAFHLHLLHELASNPNTIRRADARSMENMKPLHVHDLKGVGTIISNTDGIIEPVVEAIQRCFHDIPEEIERLYEKGIADNNFPLVWRIFLALEPMTSIVDEDLARRAKRIMNEFQTYFNYFMADYLASNIEDPNEREIFKKSLPQFKRY